MSVIKEILKGMSKFFIAISYIFTSCISIGYLLQVSSVSTTYKTLLYGLAFVGGISYLISSYPIFVFIYGYKSSLVPKQEEQYQQYPSPQPQQQQQQQQQQQDPMKAYINDIYVTVHKNNDEIKNISDTLKKIQEENANT